MRCRVGDLCVIKPPAPGYSGHFVTCDAPFGPGALVGSVDRGHHWWVIPNGWIPPDCELDNHGRFIFPDSLLRPIRPSDGEDETLTWAGKPQETVRDVISELTRGEA